jgi:Fe-S-cluster containining protein
LERLHAEIDHRTRPLDAIHRNRLRCSQGCASCCVDDLTVYRIEAEQIRRHHGPLLETETPHATGACAFLDDNLACRIYEHRPYVCRTQGYPLRWLELEEESPAGSSETIQGSDLPVLEFRDICPLNEPGGPPIEELPAEACWSIGPVEEALARLQWEIDGGLMERVRLRDLFAKNADTSADLAGPTHQPTQDVEGGEARSPMQA